MSSFAAPLLAVTASVTDETLSVGVEIAPDILLHLSSQESLTSADNFYPKFILHSCGRRWQFSEIGNGVMSPFCKQVARCFLDIFTSKLKARCWPNTSIAAAMAITPQSVVLPCTTIGGHSESQCGHVCVHHAGNKLLDVFTHCPVQIIIPAVTLHLYFTCTLLVLHQVHSSLQKLSPSGCRCCSRYEQTHQSVLESVDIPQ